MNSSAKQILIGWIYRRIGFLKRGMKKQIKPLAAILRFLDFSIPPTVISSAARNLPCTPSFLAPFAERFSPFPLSHIRHYPLLQERSLDFARDDFTEAALSKHIRCSLRGINPFPHTVISSVARNLSCTPSFLAPFAERFSPFPLSHIRHYPLLQERSLDFARDDVAEAVFSQYILYTGRGLSIPHTVISSKVEKSSLRFVLSCSFRRRFPLPCCYTYGAIPVCKKDPSASLGMTLREYRSLTLPIYFPCHNDTREAPSTFAALLFFMRRTTPLNPTT